MAKSLALGTGMLVLVSELAGGRGPVFASGCRRHAVRHVCAGCARQRARFRSYGITTWPPHATLCRRHYQVLTGRG
jgi:hypothetical protein